MAENDKDISNGRMVFIYIIFSPYYTKKSPEWRFFEGSRPRTKFGILDRYGSWTPLSRPRAVVKIGSK
ncbi:MAG: hypothetical protein A2896_01795 [Candidatus Nealsonbacteria bacterium RIFCSPLOWO2_01_FULL_43_32]|uniref:Uncharacterized protein n=1 Tax=Candidatus Nealsonbacteria bacterium RIFCSPLOWO2_01_FULL_43_32 TaxID=1801672 RepID=A0A1G2EEY1_9BACT|nr:MAG: hypothetical protein A2896_01795 [Candidatus Nealsonbacteria bacterium RIFCSPLOWO2_01_FULL_43_32]